MARKVSPAVLAEVTAADGEEKAMIPLVGFYMFYLGF